MIERFKELIRHNNMKAFFKNYIGTCLCIFLFTLYAVIFNFEENTFFATGLFLAGVGFFFVETLFKDKGRVIGYSVISALSICFAVLLELYEKNNRLQMVYAGLAIILFFTAYYFIIKDKKNLADYVTRAATNLFKVGIITSIVIIGTGILYMLIDYLLFSIEGDVYLKLVYIILGLFMAPFSLLSLVDTKEPTMGFVDLVISKVLIPIMNIVFVIMLVYICRVVFTSELPKNEIYTYVASLFVIMAPLAIVAKRFPGKYYEFNNKYLGYLFIAPLLLQIYSLGLRINQYGLTVSRYLGIFFIIFEVITIFLMSFRHQKYVAQTSLIISIFAAILLVLPVVNMEDAVILYHTNVIKGILNNTEIADLSLKERKQVYNSYSYLQDFDSEPVKKLENLVNSDNIDEICDIECREGIDNRYSSFKYLSFRSEKAELDVSNYKKIKEVYKTLNDDKKISKSIIVIDKQEVDISKYLDFIKEHAQDKDLEDMFDKYVEQNDLIKVNDNIDLLIKSFYSRYNTADNTFEYANIEGYFLYK